MEFIRKRTYPRIIQVHTTTYYVIKIREKIFRFFTEIIYGKKICINSFLSKMVQARKKKWFEKDSGETSIVCREAEEALGKFKLQDVNK